MNTWSSSVEDPEKHFLGNLLDDEASFTTASVGRTDIPSASVISGVGSIDSSVKKYWPEPPPPYTASDSSSSSWLHKSSPNFCFNDVLTTSMKEPSEWDTLLGNSDFFSKFQQPQPVFFSSLNPLAETACNFSGNRPDLLPTPPGFSPKVPFSLVVSKTKGDHPKVTPHSAPVVNKMPFSYRDVAARNETPSSGHSPPQQTRKIVVNVDNDSKIGSQSNQEVLVDRSGSNPSINKDQKPKAAEEFQKISRRRNGKEKKVLSDSISMPLLNKPKVEEPTKYHVLEKLVIPSPKIVKNDTDDSTDNIIEFKPRPLSSNMRSRSTSLCPEEENSNRSRKSESKKRTTTSIKKRNPRKKEHEGFWKLLAVAWTFIVYACDMCQYIAEWLVSLIMDVCSNMLDVFSFGFSCFFYKLEFTVRCYMLSFASWVLECMCRLKNFCRKSNTRNHDLLGYEESICISSSAADEVLRISRIRSIDAYSILGLRPDCSDEEVFDNHKQLASVLNANFCAGGHDKVEGIEYARKLVSESYTAIQNVDSRVNYDFEVQMANSEVQMDLQQMFKALTAHVDLKNNSLKCDCGRRHSRTRTDVRPQEARYCRRCASYHSAKNNDIWVETSFFGLVWHYYTCLDGVVYNITEWATCDSNYLKHLRPYSHNVQYRLSHPDSNAERSLGDQTDEKEGRSSAQASYRPPELKEEDRSRRAANRRQKRR